MCNRVNEAALLKAGAPSQIARYAGQVRKKSGVKGSGRVSDLVRRF